MLAKAARDITLHGQDPKHDIRPGGSRVHYGTAGAAVHVYDVEGRVNRDPTVQDLFDAARMVEVLDNIHFFQRPLTTRDTEDPTDLDVNTLYVSVAGTTKHIGTSFTSPERAQMGLDMLHMVAGSEAAWRARPFVSNSNCFVVPPLKFATESCRVMETVLAGGMPVLLLSAGQAGATAPAALAGAVTQATVAECLAGLIYVNAMKPGHPAIFGTWPFVSDLRTGAMSGGSGRAGAAHSRLRADGAILRPARRIGLRHVRQQGAGHAGRLRTGRGQRDGGAIPASTWSMRASACTLRCSASATRAC